MNKLFKNIFWAITTLLILALIFSFFYKGQQNTQTLSIDQLVSQINAGNVSSVTVNGNDLSIDLKNGQHAVSQKEAETGLTETLKNYGVNTDALQKVNLSVQNESGWQYWASILGPTLLAEFLRRFQDIFSDS